MSHLHLDGYAAYSLGCKQNQEVILQIVLMRVYIYRASSEYMIRFLRFPVSGCSASREDQFNVTKSNYYFSQSSRAQAKL